MKSTVLPAFDLFTLELNTNELMVLATCLQTTELATNNQLRVSILNTIKELLANGRVRDEFNSIFGQLPNQTHVGATE